MKKVLDNQCPSCKAPIVLDPKSGKFNCEYCGGSFTVDELKSEAAKDVVSKDNSYQEYVSYNCSDCGAALITDDNTAATFCVYCGNSSIIKTRLDGEFAPDSIIPFKNTKEDAKEAFKGLKKGRPFMPKEFSDEKNIEKITGVYIPFWLYDVNESGTMEIDGTVVKTWVSGDTHYTKTDKYLYTRKASMNINRIPVDGSKKFENDIMNTIEPFNFKELVPYNHAYLAGFLADKYDVNSEEAFEDAKNRAFETAKNTILSSVPASTKTIKSNDVAPTITKLEYALLPVWMLNIKWKDKYYTFAMNGQTGECVGNIPIDKKKAIIYSVVMFAVIFFVVLALHYMFFKIGG